MKIDIEILGNSSYVCSLFWFTKNKLRSMKNLPSISVIIPAFNEEINLKRLFPSLAMQTYPKEKIEYIVIDDNSTDDTAELAREFGAKVFRMKTHDIGLNKRKGIMLAKNDLVYCIDADMQICSNNFFELLVKPFLKDKKIIGSFTKEFALDGCKDYVKNSLLRFISNHPLQQDPLYDFFSPSIGSTIFEKKSDYYICKFNPGKIPAVGRILYRRKELLKISKAEKKALMDLDLESTEIVARAGYTYFAYIPKAKIRHYHAETLWLLIQKRLRNLDRNYLPNLDKKYYLWFDPGSQKDILKIIFWVIYANLLIPETVRGIIKSLYYKDVAFLWHPIVSITTTDAILWGFLSKNSGRKFALKLLERLFRI